MLSGSWKQLIMYVGMACTIDLSIISFLALDIGP
jgi:hypothetical protein